MAMDRLAVEQRLASSFAPGSTQPRVLVPPPYLSFHDYGRAEEDMENQRYHGRIDRGIRFWNLKQAKVAEIQPVCQLLDRWHEIHGERPPYIMAFVNTGSGNRKVSQAIKNQLSAILNHRFTISGRGEEDYLAGHVCELAGRIDLREEIRKTMMQPQISQLRFLVCGGDGTVTWVLHEIEELKEEHPHLFANFQEEPAIGVVPAGTGNDLARSLGWGAKLRSVRELVGYVQWTLAADIVPLDQWKVTMTFKNLLGVTVRAPPAFHEKPPPVLNSDRTFEGFFQNYFSIGMDANVALGVSQARASCIGRCCFFFGCGKCCYGAQAYRTGVFNCCSHGLSLEGHAIQYRSLAAPAATTGMETLEVGRIRQLTLANINSYASGRVLLSTEELGKSSPNDHLLELVTFPNSCAFGWVMAGGRAKVLQRAAAVRFSLERAETIQIDGEAWMLPAPCEVEVQWHRQARMLRPPTCPPGIWQGRQAPGFWHPKAKAKPRHNSD